MIGSLVLLQTRTSGVTGTVALEHFMDYIYWNSSYIKFGSLLHRLITPKDAWLATGEHPPNSVQKVSCGPGHYARVDLSEVSDSLGRTRLLRARDRFKDQTYFLSSVRETALSKVGHHIRSWTAIMR